MLFDRGGAFLPKNAWFLSSQTGVEGIGTNTPAIYDLAAQTLTPIPEPFASADFIQPNMRNLVRAVQFGPFARVTGTGSCLNVRAEPSTSGEVLDWLADGVLLTALDSEQPDPDWLHVSTPGGTTGFASRLYLDVVGP
jgi:hypothetical protein